MRYRDTGNLHLDFHRTANGTIGWLRQKYGEAFLDEILRNTARNVYRAIRNDLLAGNPEHLLEHWIYYLKREGGEFSVERSGETIKVSVDRCPAAAYLLSHGIKPDPAFRRQTIVINEALAEETPFEITTEVIDDLRYVQTVRRRR